MKQHLTSLALVAVLAVGASAGVDVDSTLPDYRPASGVSGSIKSVGSDTMNNLMALWTEAFQRHYPAVRPEIEGKGSSTAYPALISGSSTFGPMSREAKSKEQDEFAKVFGYPATQLATSIDTLAVYVHKDNPIRSLTLQQVDAIYSKTRKGGHESDIVTWGQLGLTGEWANRPITLYGRNSASGTYGYFKEHACFKGDFKDTVREQPGSSAVVASVASDITGIGYSGVGYRTADVRAVPLAAAPGEEAFEASPDNAYSGDYPMARFLWLTVNYKPGTALEPLRAEFLRLVFSREGQEVVVKDGYLPLPRAIAERELAKVGLR